MRPTSPQWTQSGQEDGMDTHLDDEREERDDQEAFEDTAAVEAAFDLAASEVEVESEAEAELDGKKRPPAVSRKVRRRSRRTRPRSRTIAMKRLTREELRLGALLNPPVDVPRPMTRSECANEIRPCPWVACKHHLYLDVNPETGSIKINFPDLEPWEMRETCALDVADRAGITLEEVGEIMNLTRERIRQVEVRGLLKLKMASPLEGFTVGDGALPAGAFADDD
jgi:Sigma-70, region 4